MARKRAKRSTSKRPGHRKGHATRRALKAVSLMRKGKSATAAARQAHTTVETVARYAGPALRHARGQYRALDADAMRRPMRIATPEGLVVADVRSSRTASKLGTYWNGVDHYLRTGDTRPLRSFRKKRFR